MRRAVDLKDISDGRLYRSSDMVKLGTGGCEGCSACCSGMEETIVLDPYDMRRLQVMRGFTLDGLLSGRAHLALIDSVVLPVLSMPEETQTCTFLSREGRCSIHDARPGICRLFPLGRYYEGGDFRYYLQTGECDRRRVKMRIRDWMDTPELPKYEDFVRSWHAFLEKLEYFLRGEEEALKKASCIYVLEAFYRSAWDPERDFYEEYEERMRSACRHFGF